MATINRFEELECWQTARELTRRVYKLSSAGAFSKDFGLRDQMRRSGVSVMSNIAEGFESRTRPLFVEFLGRAKGSAGELRAQLFVSLDAGYLKQPEFHELRDMAEKVSSQISRLSTYLKTAPEADRVGELLPPYEIPTF
jgi:four helix bundle protein